MPNESVLVAVGDVSGKGLAAALTVSLLVGALRVASESTSRPGEILSALNRGLCGRNRDGFATCVVVRADASGVLTLANAGHLAPYLNGKELHGENGLPLGVSGDATYAESTHMLAEQIQLTLVTDGVVEARGRTGELFGFDRMAERSREPAESIAQAAQEFGQDDDITVLTLTRLGTGEESSTHLSAPKLAPV